MYGLGYDFGTEASARGDRKTLSRNVVANDPLRIVDMDYSCSDLKLQMLT